MCLSVLSSKTTTKNKHFFPQIYCVALLIAVVILEIYDLPIYTAKDNLNGICLLLFMFAFATIPMVHVCEKLFNDASHAAMHILCMNIVIGVTTILIVTLFDVLGESDVRLLV